MPQTYKGPTSPIGTKKTSPMDADMNREPGQDQQQPLPNENLQNQPFSSAKTMERENQQHQWNDTDPQEGVSTGVTQGHTDPQQARHGNSGEAKSRSSTGLPEQNSDDVKGPDRKSVV